MVTHPYIATDGHADTTTFAQQATRTDTQAQASKRTAGHTTPIQTCRTASTLTHDHHLAHMVKHPYIATDGHADTNT
jgi:hypothetical protein